MQNFNSICFDYTMSNMQYSIAIDLDSNSFSFSRLNYKAKFKYLSIMIVFEVLFT